MKNFFFNTMFAFQIIFDLFLQIPMSVGKVFRRHWIKAVIKRQNNAFNRAGAVEELNAMLYKIIKNKKYIPYKWAALARHYDRAEELFVLYDTHYKRIMKEESNLDNTYFHNIHLPRFLSFVEKLSAEDMEHYAVEWLLIRYAKGTDIDNFQLCVDFLAPRFPDISYKLYEGLLEFDIRYLDHSLKPQKIALLLNHYRFDMAHTTKQYVGGDSYDYLELYWGCDIPKPRLLLILLYTPLNAVEKEVIQEYQQYQSLVLPKILEFWSTEELADFTKNIYASYFKGIEETVLHSLVDMKNALEQKKLLGLSIPLLNISNTTNINNVKIKTHKI